MVDKLEKVWVDLNQTVNDFAYKGVGVMGKYNLYSFNFVFISFLGSDNMDSYNEVSILPLSIVHSLLISWFLMIYQGKYFDVNENSSADYLLTFHPPKSPQPLQQAKTSKDDNTVVTNIKTYSENSKHSYLLMPANSN